LNITKASGTVLEGFWAWEQFGASSPRATVTSSLTAKPVDRERLLLLCPPTPSVRVTATYKKNKTQQAPFLLGFFLDLPPIDLFFLFPLVLCFRRPAV
jgi:hypothetical protein